MQLRHLLYFTTVAQELSFSRAAEALHVAQPAISQQIRALERQLGVRLFDRTGKRVMLTQAGEALLPHARRILAAVEAATAEVRELGQLQQGLALLGAAPTVSAYLLPPILAGFRLAHPQLDVRLLEAGTEGLVRHLNDGALDLAILVCGDLPPVIEATPLLDEAYLLAVSAGHPLAGAGCVALAEMAAEPFVLFPPGFKLREVTLAACRQAGFEPRVALEGASLPSTLGFVSAGLGVALLPELAVAHAPGVRGLAVTDQNLRRTLALAWRKGHFFSPAARALREFVVGSVRPGDPDFA
jgi:DNA-binding transcriptional LysR family regulator